MRRKENIVSRLYREHVEAFIIGGVVIIFAIVVSVAVASIDDSIAYDTAEGLGYENVQVSEKVITMPWFSACGKGYVAQWEVTGINPSGVEKTFTICTNLFGVGTPRF